MTKIPKNYKPKQKEKFMNAKMKEYFRQKLSNWKNELLKESSQTLNNLQSDNEAKPDITDRASEEIERSFELRTRDRERKLINKIDADTRNISDGENVKVYNDRGDFHGNARISEDVSPGIVVATLGYWRQKSKTGTVNSISSGKLADMGNAPTFSDNLVEVEKAS